MNPPNIDIDKLNNFNDFKKQWRSISMEDRVKIFKLAKTYFAFRKRYRNDLEGFILNCFKWEEKKHIYPSEDQLYIARNFQEKKRASIRALHGVGKTALAAIIVIWFCLTRDVDSDWKVITTASAWRQLTKYLWPEIHKWLKKIKWEMIGRPPLRPKYQLLDLSIKLNSGSAFAVASDNYEYIEGAHADSLLYVFDESKAIPDETWDAAEGAFSTAGGDMGTDDAREVYVLSISTPGEPMGRFFDIQSKKPGYKDWWTYHCNLKNAIEQGRVSASWADNRKLQWGETSALYKNRVLGEFAQSEEDCIIPLKYIEMAVARFDINAAKKMKVEQIGFDPARFGEDKSCMAFRSKLWITGIWAWPKTDTMASTGRVMKATANNKATVKIVVDVIGIGAGIYDRLKELGRKVVSFNAGSKTNKSDMSKQLEFVNKRAASWWMMKDLLMTEEVALPDDETLIGDLAAPKWKPTSSGKIQVESKEEIKKRLGRSTDYADAVIMAYWKERSPGIDVG